MVGHLIESKRRRERRAAGTVLSVIMHVALVGGATALASPVPPAETSCEATGTCAPPMIHVEPRRQERPEVRRHSEQRATSDVRVDARRIPSVDIDVGVALPSVTGPPMDVPIDEIAGSEGPPAHGGGDTSVGAAGAPLGALEVDEVVVPLRGSRMPRYPESLRSGNVEGRVVAEFVVDTTGRIDNTSIRILASSHEGFTAAVREALPAMRFRPARASGRTVRQIARQTFAFTIEGVR